ncbi:MAG: tRNA 2-thiouridine(34) synthase MnmA [Deltaproteobacteria bacterium]|nr:tRNA 2-thiouridine(34) synthase MnmA [Deltaproteobacteria bacterium]
MSVEIKKGARIVVAMSGGVDSSVSAAWLKNQGYDVIGISLQLHDLGQDVENTFGTCCSLSDIADARRVAEQIKIPFYVANMEEEFEASVIEDFIQEYLQGRTPNPCVRCNEKVKFSRLMQWALDLGAEYLATGHYATVAYEPESHQYELRKGDDPEKDQSYFLFTLKQQELARTVFPVGHLQKNQVRKLAQELGLVVADKPDSQEICFVRDRNYKDFIEKKAPPHLLRAGNIVDLNGKVLGTHTGIHQFTIGQHKRLTVSQTEEPLYVVAIRCHADEVVVGKESDLFRNRCFVKQLNWISPPQLHRAPQYMAKIRYRAPESPVTLYPLLDNRAEVRFNEPQRAITPGQAIVFYNGNQVMGGGWIEESAE